MAVVTLNSKKYVVKSISHYNPKRNARLPDDGIAKPWVITAKDIAQWGVGWAKSRRSRGEGVGGLNESTMDTRHAAGITLAHNSQTITGPVAGAFIRADSTQAGQAWATFKGELYLLHHDASNGTGGNNFSVGTSKFASSSDSYAGSATEIGSGANVNRTLEGADITEYDGFLYALYTLEQADIGDMFYSVEYYNLSSWTADVTGLDANAFRVNDGLTVPAEGGYPFGLLLNAPTEARHDLVAAIREESAAAGGSIDQTRIYHLPSVGGTWVNTGNVPGKPRGKGVWRDLFTSGFPAVPVISTTNNVYIVDAANSQVKPVFADALLGGDDDDGFMIAGPDNALYVANAQGDFFRVTIGDEVGAIRRPDNIGPVTRTGNGGNGVIAARQGPVSAVVTSAQFLYAAYKGASYSHIMCYSYEFGSWHVFYTASNTNRIYRMALSTADDGTQRLHIAVDAGSTVTYLSFDEPDASRVQVAFQTSVGLAPDGKIELAEEDFGDEGVSKGIIAVTLRADDLSADNTGEYMEAKYGLDGAAWDNVSVTGDFLSGTKTLQLESNSRGVSGKTLNLRLDGYRDSGGTNTDSFILHEIEVLARLKLNTLNGWEITVDLAETAAMFPGDHGADMNPEDVITNIEAARDSAPLVPFVIGEAAEFEVDMLYESLSTNLIIAGGGEGDRSGRRTGTAKFRVETIQ